MSRKQAVGGARRLPDPVRDDRDTYVVQGLRVIDSEALAAMRIPAHETAVEIPRGLLRFAVPAEKG